MWRVALSHFTPWDLNWGFGPPPAACAPFDPACGGQDPDPEPKQDLPSDHPCEQQGSVIECDSQILGEHVPIAGTPYRLHYRSDRVPGRKAAYALDIPVTGSAVPGPLQRIDLEITIAGRTFTDQVSCPCSLHQSYPFVWERQDVFGRTLQGVQPVTVDNDALHASPGTRYWSSALLRALPDLYPYLRTIMNNSIEPNIALSNVELIELHDARVKDITIERGGFGRVRFDEVSVFVEKSKELYDVWSCELALRVTGLRRLTLSGLQDVDHYVGIDDFYDSAGMKVTPRATLSSSGVKRITLLLAGRYGGEIDIEFDHAEFEDLVPQRKLEEWTGPLQG